MMASIFAHSQILYSSGSKSTHAKAALVFLVPVKNRLFAFFCHPHFASAPQTVHLLFICFRFCSWKALYFSVAESLKAISTNCCTTCKLFPRQQSLWQRVFSSFFFAFSQLDAKARTLDIINTIITFFALCRFCNDFFSTSLNDSCLLWRGKINSRHSHLI